ncbi:hypothetical protein [Pelagibacterium lacus]|uniref:hypothetical protein n=1 Tax=Pelagibacterium lacus TaxID=2282655 RepID=UPI0018F69B5C
MLRFIDFTSWQSILGTVLGLALFALIGIGIRLLVMMTIQQRQQRMNRQINERLKTLIAAYKVLGGSFTGNLTVDPTHFRDLKIEDDPEAPETGEMPRLSPQISSTIAERKRLVRDAVEAALSDILLLGTEEQVRLANTAARELLAGNRVHTHELVVSLRDFIRKALDLDPIPADIEIAMQGPSRPSGSSGRGGRGGDGGGRGGAGGGGMGGGGGAGGMGGGGGMGAPAETDATRPR